MAIARPAGTAPRASGTVLGYLMAGIALGPYGFRHVFSSSDAREFLELAEFGIILLLFIIGLELRPRRLWAMRSAIFSLGGQQVAFTAILLAAVAMVFGLNWQTSLFIGLALALSSTAFSLQIMEETGDLPQRHGRMGFAVLLFQDLAAIPLIALTPLFATAGRLRRPDDGPDGRVERAGHDRARRRRRLFCARLHDPPRCPDARQGSHDGGAHC